MLLVVFAAGGLLVWARRDALPGESEGGEPSELRSFLRPPWAGGGSASTPDEPSQPVDDLDPVEIVDDPPAPTPEPAGPAIELTAEATERQRVLGRVLTLDDPATGGWRWPSTCRT